MATLSESNANIMINGPGGLQGKAIAGRLVGGACEIDVGFNIIVAASLTPIHATTAVAIQNLTLTGVTIPINGYITTSNGKVTVKSDQGASTIQFIAVIWGM